jgi:aminomethyltransferase
MPLWYTNTTDEHLAVRNESGIFDVSHMGRVIISGGGAGDFVDYLIPTHASTQPPSKSFYTLLLNENAGIIDDLIVIKRSQDDYLLVINAATSEKDLDHIKRAASGFDVNIANITQSTTMIAIQGPEATQSLQPITSTDLAELKRFKNTEAEVGGGRASITRTGYTGEDGFEIILYDSGQEGNDTSSNNDQHALKVWTELAQNSKPCGLAARDSLRLEAGLPLYGSDIDEETNPVEADLYWVISKDKSGYVGHQRLTELAHQQRPSRIRRGLLLPDKIPRRGFEATSSTGEIIGGITSGTFSPILRKGIALAYLRSDHSEYGERISVNVRGTHADAYITKPPFYDERLYGWKRERQEI